MKNAAFIAAPISLDVVDKHIDNRGRGSARGTAAQRQAVEVNLFYLLLQLEELTALESANSREEMDTLSESTAMYRGCSSKIRAMQ